MEFLETLSKKASYLLAKLPRVVGVSMAILLAGCGSQASKDGTTATEGFKEVDQLHIVDCSLPGKVSRVGGMTYVTERRATRTTAYNCNLRGGEYVVYDRADYRSALNVWLASAQKGDPEAQTYVGEIFEKGLGQEIDYKTAANWYKKAADQGYQRAQINLGFLYEKGFGVEKDLAKALSLYRLSAGGENLVFESEAKKELETVRNQLEKEVNLAQQEADYLQNQLAELEEKVESQPEQNTQQIAMLQNMYDKAQIELGVLNDKIASLPAATYRNLKSVDLIEPVALPEINSLEFEDITFGRYFALIIGNQNYHYLDDLQSPHKDALRLQQVLENQYGFSTVTLFDATEKEILNAFNDLYHQIGPKDNLLVFYAGHGNLSKSSTGNRKRGYWLPVNAESNVLTNWISNNVISDHLDRIKARSVLVISDSCFAGNLASETSAFLLGGVNVSLSKQSIEVGLSRRSRIVISSGGEKPVLDGLDGQHSIFANALINMLESNDTILRDNMLFSRIAVNVRQQAKAINIEQTPEMRPIRSAGHEGGDFYFIPKVSQHLGAHLEQGLLLSEVRISSTPH